MSGTALPITMQLMPTGNSPFICVALTDNTLKLIDYMNEDNQSSILTMHEKLVTMKVCPNGRYVLTGGSSGDISLWSI
jgi:WD40 repeat protein